MAAALSRAALARPAPEAAPALLGCLLTSGGVTVRLSEVEAYDGANDAGSHAYRGRTPRNEVMFGPAGHLYVYFSYGMHWCANVVCGTDGTASAVLLRAGEVVAGEDLARSRRGAAMPFRDLARGPARLCQALGVDKQCNGVDVLATEAPVRLRAGVPPDSVSRGPRVGLRGAPDQPWRFWVTDDRTVSTYRPHQPRRRGR
ncbi:MAG TPA: DNA-3-methyladenine glycosylase [Nocardioidaceae bacterium]|nr:DNA-3-methyladenine glycosylase [Nocardioidaceae bacterium]